MGNQEKEFNLVVGSMKVKKMHIYAIIVVGVKKQKLQLNPF